jgi:hypothetical protein
MPNETMRMTRKYNGGKYNGRKTQRGAGISDMVDVFNKNVSALVSSVEGKLTGVNSTVGETVGGWWSKTKGLFSSNGTTPEPLAKEPATQEQAGGIKRRRAALNKTRRRVRVRN